MSFEGEKSNSKTFTKNQKLWASPTIDNNPKCRENWIRFCKRKSKICLWFKSSFVSFGTTVLDQISDIQPLCNFRAFCFNKWKEFPFHNKFDPVLYTDISKINIVSSKQCRICHNWQNGRVVKHSPSTINNHSPLPAGRFEPFGRGLDFACFPLFMPLARAITHAH